MKDLFSINACYPYIYIYIFKISSQCPKKVGVDYSLHRICEKNHINL